MPPEPTLRQQRKRLAAWMAEWQLDHALRETTDAVPPVLGTDPPDFASPSLGEGEIRLWPAKAANDPPCYVLLLSCGDAALWRALPFSRFSQPASPEEFRVRGKPPCQVLQAWNQRWLAAEQAGQSWRVGGLAPSGMTRLHTWLRALEAGTPLPDGLAKDCGPPLRHPLDPRHPYREEEWERVSRVLGETIAPPRVLPVEPTPSRPLLRFEDARERAWTRCLPVVGRLAAGQAFHGFEADGLEAVMDLPWVEVPARWAGPRRFVVRVAGDSMEPTLRKGALAVFEYHRNPRREGEIVIANLQAHGGDVGTETIKRLYATPTHWRFVPDNPDHPILEVPREELPYPILGTFLGVLDPF